MGKATSLLAAAALLALASAGAARAQVAPDARWRTVTSEHFRVHYEPGLEPLARHAAARAERAWVGLSALTRPPAAPVDIVLSDDADFSNGYSVPIPSNRVYVYVKPPVDNLGLAYYRDWLDLVLVHELTHTFQLDRAGAVGRVLRHVFGRAPLAWPVFPELLVPGWTTEGLAVEYETLLTGAGRNAGTFHDMILRTAVLQDRFSSIDRASSPDPLWPEGDHAYAYGSLFVDYLRRRFGPDATSRIVDRTAGSVPPPSLFFDHVGKRAFSESFSALWADWHAEMGRRYGALADSLRDVGLTAARRLTRPGRYAAHPRVAPDGGLVAFAASTGRDDPQTRLLEPGTGRVRVLARRNADGDEMAPASWLPDGSGLVTSGFEFRGPYRIYEDLYLLRLDGRRQRLTRGARLTEPDVAPDGRRVVAVRNGGGGNALVIFDLRSHGVRAIVPPRPGVQWALPRWSPDGRWIAVSRWADGGDYDVVVLDTTGALRLRITHDRAIDRDAAWSPDGRWLLFSSDRSGIPDLYAADVGAGLRDGAGADGAAPVALRQVTRLLTGAFEPDVAPDGRSLYFTRYAADGYHVARMPFDPAGWTPASPLAARFRATPPPEASVAAPDSSAAAATGPAEGYSAWATLRPYFWLPVLTSGGWAGTGVGAATGGEDVVGRHTWGAWATYAPDTHRTEGAASYRYAGVGNPVLGVDLSREWDLAGRARLNDGSVADVLSAENTLRLSASFRRARWRNRETLTLGVEGVAGRRLLDSSAGRLRDDLVSIRRYGGFASVSASSARAYDFSISPERGLTAVLTARLRRDVHDTLPLAEQYSELVGRVTGYRPVRAFGFADHVIAVRAAGLLRHGDSAPLASLGGVSGDSYALGVGGVSVGAARLLPVRGYPRGVRAGTRGWSASLEYRLPIALVARGPRLWPAFLQSLSATAFLDAGNAWCTAAQDARSACNPLLPSLRADPLLSTGAELQASLAVLFSTVVKLRGGVAWPLTGPEAAGATAYLAVGPSF